MIHRVIATVMRQAAFVAMLAVMLSTETRAADSMDEASLEALRAAVDSDVRSQRHKDRDQYRHPYETLKFFGVKPDMTVVEILPMGGYYTSILGPYLKEKGEYYAVLYPAAPDNDYITRGRRGYLNGFAEKPDLYGDITVTDLDTSPGGKIAPDGSADMVLTFRNVHNWMGRGYAETVFERFFQALKPGGVLGVVEHRRPEGGDPQDPRARSGYVKQSYVVKLATQAGFRLVGQSEVNANPDDTADHPEGVWTLPPSLRLGDQDREKYLTIGESDRMTLKFVKPGGDELLPKSRLKLDDSAD